MLKPSSRRQKSPTSTMASTSTSAVPSPRKCAASTTVSPKRCWSASAVSPGVTLDSTSAQKGIRSRRDPSLDLVLKHSEAVHEHVRRGRTARNVHVHRNDLIDSLHHCVVVEDATRR